MKLSTPTAKNGAAWQFVADGVMGGLSKSTMVRETIGGRNALRMRGTVSLENNGGFIQVALDLSPDGSPIDASAFSGVEIDVIGNGETYNLHLRTADLSRAWQSYRHSFDAGRNWETHRLPFADFNSYRTAHHSTSRSCAGSDSPLLAAPSRLISQSVASVSTSDLEMQWGSE